MASQDHTFVPAERAEIEHLDRGRVGIYWPRFHLMVYLSRRQAAALRKDLKRPAKAD